jgi:hypothetical protein
MAAGTSESAETRSPLRGGGSHFVVIVNAQVSTSDQ